MKRRYRNISTAPKMEVDLKLGDTAPMTSTTTDHSTKFHDAVDYFEQISLEVICHVLSYLPLRDVLKLERLRRKLQAAVTMHLKIRRVIDFTEGQLFGSMPGHVTDNCLIHLLSRCEDLQYIYGFHPVSIVKRRSRRVKQLSIRGVIDALSQVSNLQGIEVSNIFLLEAILTFLPKVEILGTFRNRDRRTPIPASNRFSLSANPFITSMNLKGVTLPELPRMDVVKHIHMHWVRLNQNPFKEFSAPNLQTFVMANCAGPVNALKYVPLMTALAGARYLSRLVLIRVPFLGGLIQHLVEDSWRVRGFRVLESITLGACKHALEVDLGFLVTTCAFRLENLSIQPSLTKDSFFSALNMAGVHFPHFDALVLGYVDPVSFSRQWTNAQLVAAGLADIIENPAMITDIGMRAAGEVFLLVRRVDVYNCPHLHYPTTWLSRQAPCWNNLRELTLRRCHAVRLPDFCRFIPMLPALESLNLEAMFTEPPKGCARVGLSAGTGLGVSSALVSNTGNDPANNDSDMDMDDELPNQIPLNNNNEGEPAYEEPRNSQQVPIQIPVEPLSVTAGPSNEKPGARISKEQLSPGDRPDPSIDNNTSVCSSTNMHNDERTVTDTARKENNEVLEIDILVENKSSVVSRNPKSTSDDAMGPEINSESTIIKDTSSKSVHGNFVPKSPKLTNQTPVKNSSPSTSNTGCSTVEMPSSPCHNLSKSTSCTDTVSRMSAPEDRGNINSIPNGSDNSRESVKDDVQNYSGSTENCSVSGINRAGNSKQLFQDKDSECSDVLEDFPVDPNCGCVVCKPEGQAVHQLSICLTTPGGTPLENQPTRRAEPVTSFSRRPLTVALPQPAPALPGGNVTSLPWSQDSPPLESGNDDSGEKMQTEETTDCDLSPVDGQEGLSSTVAKGICSSTPVTNKCHKKVGNQNCQDIVASNKCAPTDISKKPTSAAVLTAYSSLEKKTASDAAKCNSITSGDVRSSVVDSRSADNGTDSVSIDSAVGSPECKRRKKSEDAAAMAVSDNANEQSANQGCSGLSSKGATKYKGKGKGKGKKSSSKVLKDLETCLEISQENEKTGTSHLKRTSQDIFSGEAPSARADTVEDDTQRPVTSQTREKTDTFKKSFSSGADDDSMAEAYLDVDMDEQQLAEEPVKKVTISGDTSSSYLTTHSEFEAQTSKSLESSSFLTERDLLTDQSDGVMGPIQTDTGSTGDNQSEKLKQIQDGSHCVVSGSISSSPATSDTRSHGVKSGKGKALKGKSKSYVKSSTGKVSRSCQAVSEEIREATKKAKEGENAGANITPEATDQGSAKSESNSKSAEFADERTGIKAPQPTSYETVDSTEKFVKRPVQRRANMCDQSTSTSDPVIEDDHVQVLTIRSRSLESLTLHRVGITDLIIQDCPSLSSVQGTSCRVLKKVNFHRTKSLHRVTFVQCKKLDERHLVEEVCKQPSSTSRNIFLRPMKKVDLCEMEKLLFQTPNYNYHMCLVRDHSERPKHTLHNRMRVAEWCELFHRINHVLTNSPFHFPLANGKRTNQNSGKYPWGRRIYHMNGHSPDNSQWDVMTDVPWLRCLSECPDVDSPNLAAADRKDGVYCPNAKGHGFPSNLMGKIEQQVAELREEKLGLYHHCVLLFMKTCDMDGSPTPDIYV